MNRNASQRDRYKECENVGRSGHSLELEAEAGRAHPREASSNHLPNLYADQEGEVQAEDLFPPQRHHSLQSEQFFVKSNE